MITYLILGRFWGLGNVFSIDWAFSMSLRTWSLSGRRVCLCRSVFRCFHPFGVGIIHPIISDSSSFTRSIGIGFDGQAGKIWQTLSSPIMLTMATLQLFQIPAADFCSKQTIRKWNMQWSVVWWWWRRWRWWWQWRRRRRRRRRGAGRRRMIMRIMMLLLLLLLLLMMMMMMMIDMVDMNGYDGYADMKDMTDM